MKPYSFYLTLLLSSTSSLTQAGVREEVGYHHLLSYAGATLALPSGAGTYVEMVESDTYTSSTDPDNLIQRYMPNPGNSQLADIFTDLTGNQDGTNYSSHSTTVATYYVGSTLSLSPDSDNVGVREANDYLNNFLGSAIVGTSSSEVTSHAYILTKSYINNNEIPISTINDLIARFDYSSYSSDTLNVTGMNNGSSSFVPPIWGSAYNCISVGRSDGQHSHGTTDADYANPGRQKPDIVTPTTTTSWGVGFLSSAAKLLKDKANSSGNSDAALPDTIKACLLAGATKEEFPNWSQTSSKPLDTTYGAGELNIYNSYRILEQTEATTSSASHWGWSRNNIPSVGSPSNKIRTYTFTTPNYPAGSFSLSAALIWQRPVSAVTYTYGSLADLKLELLDGSSSVIQTSDSSVDNVEHIWNTTLQPNSTYSLRVTSNSGSGNFSLAWRTDYTPLQPIAGNINVGSSSVGIDFSRLIPNVDYVVQRSTTLLETSWSDVGTIAPTTTSEPFTDSTPAAGTEAFYRLLPIVP